MNFISNIWGALFGLITAIVGCLIIVKTLHYHGDLSVDHTVGVQKFHSEPTPRIGGVALLAGYLVCWFFAAGESRDLLGWIGIASIPVVIFGLAEDITKVVSVRARMIAALAAGVSFCLLTGYSIERVYVWWFDYLLAAPIFSVAFTAFAIASAANATNIIDGFHGLASGTILIVLASIGLVTWSVGDTGLLYVTISIAAITAGFFVVNFPFGKIFLGDGGAYFLGFLVATLTVILPARNPEVSPWISPLILSYPLTEMVVSIARKIRREGHHPGQPDDLHLHMLVYKIFANGGNQQSRNEFRNHVFTSASLWMFPTASLVLVATSGFEAHFAIWSIISLFFAYLVVYNVVNFRVNKIEIKAY